MYVIFLNETEQLKFKILRQGTIIHEHFLNQEI